MTENEIAEAIRAAAEDFIARSLDELAVRQKLWKVDLSQIQVHEVVGALLARQATLSSELAYCPPIWNANVAPLILRAMADVYISMAWILGDPAVRSRQFVEHGLGRLKLELEHRKAQQEHMDDEQKHYIEACEDWINHQRRVFLLSVDLGSWSGLSTRDMAKKAGQLDFYNYVYTPFSACTHSMWHHIGRLNLIECENPLHRYHRVPACPELSVDTEYLYLAAKYLQKTFTTFDEAVCIEPPAERSAFECLVERLSQIAERDRG